MLCEPDGGEIGMNGKDQIFIRSSSLLIWLQIDYCSTLGDTRGAKGERTSPLLPTLPRGLV